MEPLASPAKEKLFTTLWAVAPSLNTLSFLTLLWLRSLIGITHSFMQFVQTTQYYRFI